ncbi:calcium-independent phospholipase a2-gamma [Anaeramoeba ignava]|uniref:Calcium-independent phospholipase a2-gamma n=1 Tax=Anaeramoeba ignava TaxID=1746090 RepID=A0A9Q0L8K5_ANAIG|nr:calcium-independent phospholipase a2-gamma [Anaeramoeba ignava]|eukprot:Anaeramoba_ignava/a611454_18.p1 GENE.a611454_18~~a611454_18.p1  ORF type:complete len:399 (+),score=150.21 a611454_18:1-1197(+)
MQNKKIFRCLSIDGGGIRGIIPLVILCEIEKKTNKSISELFDFISGTSTGGIIALALSIRELKQNNDKFTNPVFNSKFSAETLLDYYKNLGQTVFTNNPIEYGINSFKKRKKSLKKTESINENNEIEENKEIEENEKGVKLQTEENKPKEQSKKSFAKSLFSSVANFGAKHLDNFVKEKTNFTFLDYFKTKYPRSGIDSLLKKFFGELKMNECFNQVFIPSFNVSTREPIFFTNKNNTKIRKVAGATSAAPTYFDPAKIEDDFYLDGGVFANNPCLSMFSLLSQRTIPISNMFIVSLGTGLFKPPIHEKIIDAGKLEWSKYIFDIFIDSGSDLVDFSMKQLFSFYPNQYFRFQSTLDKEIILDDCSTENIQYLENLAKKMIQQNQDQIDLVCKILTSN